MLWWCWATEATKEKEEGGKNMERKMERVERHRKMNNKGELFRLNFSKFERGARYFIMK